MKGILTRPRKLVFGTTEHSARVDFILERIRASEKAKQPVEEMGLTAYKNLRSYLNKEKHPFPVFVYDPVFFGSLMTEVATTVDAMFVSPPIFDYETDKTRGGDDASTAALQSESDDHLERMRPWLPVVKGSIGQHLVGTQYWDFWWDYQEKVCTYREPGTVKREFLDAWGQPSSVEIPTVHKTMVTEPLFDGPRFAPRHITRAYADTDSEDLQRGGFYARRDELDVDEVRLCAKLEEWDTQLVERAIRDTGSDGIKTGIDSIRDLNNWLEQIGLNTRDTFRSIVDRKKLEVIRFYYRSRGQVLKGVLLNRAVCCYDGPANDCEHGLFPAVKSTSYCLTGEHFGISDWEITRWLIQGIQTLRNAGCAEAVIGTMPVLLKQRDMQVDNAVYAPNAIWEMDDVDGLKPLNRGSNGAALGNNEADLLRSAMDSAIGSGGETGRGNVDAKATATAVQQALGAAGVRGKFRANMTDECFVVPGCKLWGELVRSNSENTQVMQAKVIELATAAASINMELTQKRLMQLHQIAQNSPIYKPDEGIRAIAQSIAPKEAERLLKSPEEMAEEMRAQQAAAMAGMGMPGPGGPSGPGAGGPPLSGREPFEAGDPMAQQAAELRETMAA